MEAFVRAVATFYADGVRAVGPDIRDGKAPGPERIAQPGFQGDRGMVRTNGHAADVGVRRVRHRVEIDAPLVRTFDVEAP